MMNKHVESYKKMLGNDEDSVKNTKKYAENNEYMMKMMIVKI